jgi:hypothetical protein
MGGLKNFQNHNQGFRSKFYNNRRVSECRNKLFEEVLLEGLLKLVSIFKEESKNLAFDFLQAIRTKKI